MSHALDVLDFGEIRNQLAAECETSLGRPLALTIAPTFDAMLAQQKVARTREATEWQDRGWGSMAGLHDVREPVRLAGKGGTLEGLVLARIARYLEIAGEFRESLISGNAWPQLVLLAESLPQLATLKQKLDRSLDLDGNVKDEASRILGGLRSKRNTLAQRSLDRIQSYLSGSTRALLSDPIYTQRDGRYVLPLKAENKGKIKGIVHDTSASGLTVFVEPQDVLALTNDLRETEGKIREEERRILTDLSRAVGGEVEALQSGLDAFAEIDLVRAIVRLGDKQGGCIPEVGDGPWIKIETGRHPLLDRQIAVPFSLEIGGEIDVVLITGPNTGGKTVTMKAVGLAVAMSQCGMMPCARSVSMGCFRQIWADIGDEQSLQQSLSTFSGHIKQIAAALAEIKPHALVLLDEAGAGTDPAEGSALARAILLAFQEAGAKVLASTHYGELKLLATQSPGFQNASMEFDRKSLRPTYRLLVGVPGSSHAFHIAERYGIPKSVIETAETAIDPEVKSLAETIARLEQSEKLARTAQSEADRLAARLRVVEKDLEEKVAEATEVRTKVRSRAATELEEVLREIRIEAADVFASLKKDRSDEALTKARKRLDDLQDVGQSFVKEMRPAIAKPKPAIVNQTVVKGSRVRLRGLNQEGTVLDEPKGKAVAVQVGSLRMNVALSELDILAAPVTPKSNPKASRSGHVQRAQNAQRELHLRRLRAEEAADTLEKFIDDAVLAGLPNVRIVHGKGEGVLRGLTRDILRAHKDVKSFGDAAADQGGDGVTEAELR
ncbi:MAG: endonuclease MutS2 [Fimbriimonadaceae bacterium]|nr:endonuclease MutS2 [Fimbriimonadaceae bacterium]